jgi:hypothetical protein
VNLPLVYEWILGRNFFDLLLSSAVRSRYFEAFVIQTVAEVCLEIGPKAID